MNKPRVRNTSSTLSIELEQVRALNVWDYMIGHMEDYLGQWINRTALGSADTFEGNQGVCRGLKMALDYMKDPLSGMYLRSESRTTGVRPAPVADNHDTAPDDDNIQ
jgi:hypothetical protein